jgi:hypothetical protein
VVFLGKKNLLLKASRAGLYRSHLKSSVDHIIPWLAVLGDKDIRDDFKEYQIPELAAAVNSYMDNRDLNAAQALVQTHHVAAIAGIADTIINSALTADDMHPARLAKIVRLDEYTASDIAGVRSSDAFDRVRRGDVTQPLWARDIASVTEVSVASSVNTVCALQHHISPTTLQCRGAGMSTPALAALVNQGTLTHHDETCTLHARTHIHTHTRTYTHTYTHTCSHTSCSG